MSASETLPITMGELGGEPCAGGEDASGLSTACGATASGSAFAPADVKRRYASSSASRTISSLSPGSTLNCFLHSSFVAFKVGTPLMLRMRMPGSIVPPTALAPGDPSLTAVTKMPSLGSAGPFGPTMRSPSGDVPFTMVAFVSLAGTLYSYSPCAPDAAGVVVVLDAGPFSCSMGGSSPFPWGSAAMCGSGSSACVCSGSSARVSPSGLP
mmetsp:Transcript_13514/g.34697  ORF Transcript_13514/g.34697 Transcript_13514/m.34697 type:complete len:211 (-) Transcript_13514:4054-4686(-)